MRVSLFALAMGRKSFEQTAVTKQLRRARESTGVLNWFESSTEGVAPSIDERLPGIGKLCPKKIAAAICEAEAPCSANRALYPHSSLTLSPRSTTRHL